MITNQSCCAALFFSQEGLKSNIRAAPVSTAFKNVAATVLALGTYDKVEWL